jgi:hypothetical protein
MRRQLQIAFDALLVALAGLIAWVSIQRAEPATPALVPLLNDPSEGVRVAATNALRAISLNAASGPGTQ